MVIELSGVQFGLKSYAWFQNRTSAQREFDLKKNCTPLSSITTFIIKSILKSPKYRTWPIQIFYWCITEAVFK